MKEQMAGNERKGQCPHVLPENIVFKDVVIIGNGPSGLCTSYMLSGWLPHLAPGPLQTSDEMLTARLSALTPGQCLLDADLTELAEGLQGRSHNPVPLLMDNLQYPCADMGLDLDPLLEWRFHPDKKVDHIVLGSGPPGGAWHSFASKVMTLSPARWLSLPPHRSPSSGAGDGEGLQRAHAQAVADYYRQYVTRMGLQKYFRSGVAVRNVRRVRPVSVSCLQTCPLRATWCVQGCDQQSGDTFTYVCLSVVLACGSSDLPHRLPACPANTVHTGNTDDILNTHAAQKVSLPVLVVGSGLSAADAIVRARSSGASVLHVYHKAAVGLRDLSPSVYPEYHQVYQMMCKGTAGNFERYTALPEHEIQEVSFVDDPEPAQNTFETQLKREDAELKTKSVKFVDTVSNVAFEKTVSLIFVLIGSRPNLNFLPDNLNTNLFNLKTSERTLKNRKLSDRTQISGCETLDACCESRMKNRDRRSWTLDVVSEWDRDRVCAHTDTPENVMRSHTCIEKVDENYICLKCAHNNNTSIDCFDANIVKNKKKCIKNELKSRWSNLHNNYVDEIEFTQIKEQDDSQDIENHDVNTNKSNFNDKRSFSVNDVVNCDNGINGYESDNINDSCNNSKTDSINGRCANINDCGSMIGIDVDSNGHSSYVNGNSSCRNCNTSYINGVYISTDICNNGERDINNICINVNESDLVNGSGNNNYGIKGTCGIGKRKDVSNEKDFSCNNDNVIGTKSYISMNDNVNGINENEGINGFEGDVINKNEIFNGSDNNGINCVITDNEINNDANNKIKGMILNSSKCCEGGVKENGNLKNIENSHLGKNITNRKSKSSLNSNSSTGHNSGLGLGYGLDPSKPIDCRSNPMNVDKRTHQVRNFGKGLYALGPLTGDNFVRFIPGGALAIVSHMWKDSKSCS